MIPTKQKALRVAKRAKCVLGLLLIAVTHLLAPSAQGALTISWGNQIGSTLTQSDGATPLDSSFEVIAGYFNSPFTPSATNVDQWVGNYTAIGTAVYNLTDSYFSGQATLPATSTVPTGTQLYVWIRNGTSPVAPTQWFLATNNSSDGSAANDWVMPDLSATNQTTRPLQLDLNPTTLPNLDVLFGGTPTDTGGGEKSSTPSTTYDVQTYTFPPIPEPSSALMLSLACLVFSRRSRGAASAQFRILSASI